MKTGLFQILINTLTIRLNLKNKLKNTNVKHISAHETLIYGRNNDIF